jgi:dUTP pyrophosphatase
MKLGVKLVREGAVCPERASENSAGLDLSACISKPVRLEAGQSCIIPTGIALSLPQGSVGLVFGRSGLGMKHGIVPSNAVGVIDADYRGEVMVGLRNQSAVDYTIMPGERVAQLVLIPVAKAVLCLSDELEPTGRGESGMGSTGRF